MGSKRIGLARVEALIENLKRELKLNGSVLKDFIVGGAGDASATQGGTGEVGHFTVRKESEAAGYHIYQEEVSLVGTSNATDNAVLVYLSKSLPANAQIVQAAMTVTELASVATFDVNLQITGTSDTALGTAISSPVELIGTAGGSGKLVCGSGETAGVTMGRAASSISGGGRTSIAVCNDGASNGTDALTSGSVIVTIAYYGSAAPA